LSRGKKRKKKKVRVPRPEGKTQGRTEEDLSRQSVGAIRGSSGGKKRRAQPWARGGTRIGGGTKGGQITGTPGWCILLTGGVIQDGVPKKKGNSPAAGRGHYPVKKQKENGKEKRTLQKREGHRKKRGSNTTGPRHSEKSSQEGSPVGWGDLV